MPSRKTRYVIEREKLCVDRIRDLDAAVAGRAGKQPGAAIQDGLGALSVIIDPRTTRDDFWCRAKIAIGGKRHPVVVQVGSAPGLSSGRVDEEVGFVCIHDSY